MKQFLQVWNQLLWPSSSWEKGHEEFVALTIILVYEILEQQWCYMLVGEGVGWKGVVFYLHGHALLQYSMWLVGNHNIINVHFKQLHAHIHDANRAFCIKVEVDNVPLPSLWTCAVLLRLDFLIAHF